VVITGVLWGESANVELWLRRANQTVSISTAVRVGGAARSRGLAPRSALRRADAPSTGLPSAPVGLR
jgi:hypothetical protein